ncbi:MAG: gamma-glutamyl-gamma-aminobutyrate hydrolase family protein [Candidatus Nanoarchaeia archaeon]
MSVGKSHYLYDFLYDNYTQYYQDYGLELIPVSNFLKDIPEFLEKNRIEGVLLSGGNSVHPERYGSTETKEDASKERDQTEETLIQEALNRNIPILGICRGMQFLNVFFGGKLRTREGHVRVIHEITLDHPALPKTASANSFHNEVILKEDLSQNLKSFALTDDVVEGFYHPSKPVAAIQWHPERDESPEELNKLLLNAFKLRELFWK